MTASPWYVAGASFAALFLAGCGSDPASEAPSDEGARIGCSRARGVTRVYSGETHGLVDLSAPCRAEGERVAVFVADELWGSAVTRADAIRFVERLESAGAEGSYRPELGILPANELVFAPLEPSALPNGKLELFIVDTQGAGEGYLCSWCESPQLHLDGRLLSPLTGEEALSIAAHEIFHAIHRAHDPDETVWIDETLGEAAMTVNGYFTDQDWLAAFLDQPNVDWGPGHGDVRRFQYGAGLLFGSYLWEQGGPELMSALTREPLDGWEGLDAALSEIGESRTGFEFYLDLALAVFLDQPETGFGFASFDYEPVGTRGELQPGESSEVALAAYGLAYHPIAADASAVVLAQAGSGVVARAFDQASGDIVTLEVGRSLALGSGEWFVATTSDRTASYLLSAE